MESTFLLQRYRSDRRNLLEFLLSSGLIKEIRTPTGPTVSLSNINLDAISVDYVIECVQSGGVLDVSLAAKKYHDEHGHPKMMHLHTGDAYFLVSDPELAGSPPQRMPPPIINDQSNDNGSYRSYPKKLPFSGDEYGVNCKVSGTSGSFPSNQVDMRTIGLPTLNTGLSDDDLCKSAYEVFLACMVCSGIEIQSAEGKKKEKSSRFLAGLKNRREKRHTQSQSLDRNSELIEIIRMQMQISEAMDSLTRRKLSRFASAKAFEQIDVPQISLGLLNGTSKSEFQNEKSYIQWKNRQANILEEVLSLIDDVMTAKQSVRILLAKIRNSEEWEIKMSPSERREVLFSIKHIALTLSSMPGNCGIQGETYYWSAGFHLNIRLYEKLLLGVFDILEDGLLIEEAEDILNLIKSTWPVLGITQKLHDVLFGWVLFQQYVGTEESMLLDYAVHEVQKVMLSEDIGKKEKKYLESLLCCTFHNGSEIRLNLVESILRSISCWCDNKLQDYHLHFSQPSLFKGVVTMALVAGNQNFDASGNTELLIDASNTIIDRKVRMYVERSVEAACKRVAGEVNVGSKVNKIHPLALLASELRLIAERQLTVYHPVLRDWCPEAGIISALKLHRFYGQRLEPFLKDVSCLSEDTKEVLTSAILLENSLLELHSSDQVEDGLHSPFMSNFVHYKIGEISRPIILDWVIAQQARILEWTGRASDLEDWESLSHQQKHAASAVEVFRIIEETVDQFFELRLPVDITHLQALLSIIFHTLDAYLQKVVSQLVDKRNLYPPAPPLTRYKEAAFPIVKKKLVESVVLDNAVNNKLNGLTTSKLCVRMNTLQYMQKQISTIEDGIRKSWASARHFKDQECTEEDSPLASNRTLDMCSDSVSELFVATFDCIRNGAANAIRKTCDFVGARVVFWDMRESFLFQLYHGGVEGARLDTILPQFDRVLNNVCGLIDDALRDLVVSSIFKASLEGYIWVLLDGGPSRAFSDFDVVMMEDDLNILKDLFVADGEGLPRSFVEEEARFPHQILSLFSLQAESVIQMLMTSSEHSSTGLEAHKHGHRHLGDAHTLIRVLCHKKEREASKFLKRHYHLPASSDYDEATLEDSPLKSPLVADLIKRSTSFRFSDKGSSSFRSLKKKFQEATSDLRHVAW